MNFELVSLDGIKFKAQAYSIVLPTAAGQITVLPNHEPLLAQLVPGVITIRREKSDADYKLEHYATYGGVLKVASNSAQVLVDEAAAAEEINEAEAQKAHDTALRLRAEAKNQVELDKAQSLVDRHAVRLEVANLRRRHRDRR